MKDLSISIIEPVGGHGGMNFYDYGLSIGLANNNVEVYFFTSNSTEIIDIENVHTIHSFASMWRQKNTLLKAIIYIKGLYNAIKVSNKKKVSVLHLHAFHIDWLFYFAVTLCKLSKFKVVVTIHDVTTFSGKRIYPYFEKKLIYKIDEIIVHNQYSLTEIDNLYPDRNYNLIRHGNYIPFIKKVNKQQIKIPFKILFFGQIKQVKGLDVLLEALYLIKERNINCQLTIAGKVWKDSFEKYQNIINEKKLTRSVIADIKYIPDNKIWDYFNETNLVVLPYKKIYQSGVLLMAMSFGRAVLASDLPAFTEVIKSDCNGYLFKSEDPISLANKIQDIINSNNLHEVEDRGYRNVSRKFDWTRIGLLTKDVYNKVIKAYEPAVVSPKKIPSSLLRQ